MPRDLVTTILDALALLLVAAGLGFAASHLIGWAALAVSGLVIGAGSWLAAHPGALKQLPGMLKRQRASE